MTIPESAGGVNRENDDPRNGSSCTNNGEIGVYECVYE
jgi:hypothetical protein